MTAAELIARADEIDRRLGPIPGHTADAIAVQLREAAKALANIERACSDCPPIGYPTDKTRCSSCPRLDCICRLNETVMDWFTLPPKMRTKEEMQRRLIAAQCPACGEG